MHILKYFPKTYSVIILFMSNLDKINYFIGPLRDATLQLVLINKTIDDGLRLRMSTVFIL